MNGDDSDLLLPDSSDTEFDVLGAIYDDILGDDGAPPTLDDWKAMDVESSSVAWMNQFLNGGPLEDFDRFVLTTALGPDDEEDAYPDDHYSIDFSPVVWSLLRKEARSAVSREQIACGEPEAENVRSLY